MKHEYLGYEECSLFNSSHEYSRGFNRARCSCGWKSAPVKGQPALVAIFDSHVRDAKQELQDENDRMRKALMMLRCEVTKNPCGTDTHVIGDLTCCHTCRVFQMGVLPNMPQPEAEVVSS